MAIAGECFTMTARIRRIARLLVVLLPLLFCSCQSPLIQRLTKARAAPVSPFLDKDKEMRPQRNRLPVHCAWQNLDKETQAEVERRKALFIAPVTLEHLKPASERLARWEMKKGLAGKREEMAEELRERFKLAFVESPEPKYQIVDKPGRDTLTLELAITQLRPTSVAGNVVRVGSIFFIGPLSILLSPFPKGNIAIEGKLSLSDTKTTVMQFADNERDKLTLYTARDFRPYGHALQAMDEWARQFEEYTRTHRHHKVKESSFITLKPW